MCDTSPSSGFVGSYAALLAQREVHEKARQSTVAGAAGIPVGIITLLSCRDIDETIPATGRGAVDIARVARTCVIAPFSKVNPSVAASRGRGLRIPARINARSGAIPIIPKPRLVNESTMLLVLVVIGLALIPIDEEIILRLAVFPEHLSIVRAPEPFVTDVRAPYPGRVVVSCC
jgi:hypothetical protein